MADQADIQDPDSLLSESEAARFLNLSVRTLQAWRVKGVGPRYVKLGRAIRYCRSDLLDWINRNSIDPDREAS